MFQRILVAYDGSEGARAALRLGVRLAKGLGAELYSVSVEEPLPRYAATTTEVRARKEEVDLYFRQLTKEARDQALVEGAILETLVRQGHEVETILTAARERRFDLLLIGHQGHSRIFERIIGSTALSVARLAPCSVLFARPPRTPGAGEGDIKRILVGVDGSPLGRLALQTALDLAILFGARLTGVTVRQASPLARPDEAGQGVVEQLKAAAEAHARAAEVPYEHAVRAGHSSQALCAQAREGEADLLVLGATGLEHPWSVTIGGTATNVVSEAPCAVLLVRPPQAILHVRDVMVRGVSSVTPDAPLSEVIELLLRRNVKALPVVDSRRHVVGIITGGDLLKRGDLDLRLSIEQEMEADALRERLRTFAESRLAARDVMTRRVHTVEADLDLAGAVRMMVGHRVKRLPVVDREDELIGILSRADVLRAIAALPEVPEPGEGGAPGGRSVGDAATIEVSAVSPLAPAQEVLEKIIESPLRRVVVAGPDGKVLGLISDRDFLARSTPGTRPWVLRLLGAQRPVQRSVGGRTPLQGLETALTASDFMAPSLVTVRPEDSLAHAIRLMMQHQVKRLVVVDDDGRFRGLVDRREILRLLAARSGL